MPYNAVHSMASSNDASEMPGSDAERCRGSSVLVLFSSSEHEPHFVLPSLTFTLTFALSLQASYRLLQASIVLGIYTTDKNVAGMMAKCSTETVLNKLQIEIGLFIDVA
jgi:hypothetical protein